ncbi:MAG: hypothetical protein ACYDDA_05880 [Acidiferrobacteraceae bacterium]
MSTNNLFTMNSSPTSSSSALGSINSGLNSLAGTLNSLSNLALPLEKDVGGVSQLYTQIKQMNPQAQTTIPVNEAFYQAPQGSLTGNFANGLSGMFNNMPWYGYLALGGGVIGVIWLISKKK